MNKGKILWLTDSPLSCTGYATISRNILNGLVEKGWECYCMGHNYVGQPLPPGVKLEDGTEIKFTLMGVGLKPYCEDLIEPMIKKIQPNIFGVLLDTFMLYPWILNQNFSPAKSVFYFPSDGGGGLPLGCDNVLRKFNCAVAMAKFGQKQVLETHSIQTDYIPHAIDPQNYHSVSNIEKDACKARFGVHGKFVIGVVARNQGRKMLDRTFKTFNLIKDKMPDAVLLLHLDPQDAAQVFPITEMIKRYNLENRCFFTGMRYFSGFNYKDMNSVYNAMDLFLLTTSGEGFGVPIIEAMACEIPVIATDYTTTPELIIEDGQCGEAAKVSTEITGSWMVERALMDNNDAAEKIIKLYNNPALREQYGKTGRAKVLREYCWEKIINEWDSLLTKMVNK